jgi:hypothetical protein
MVQTFKGEKEWNWIHKKIKYDDMDYLGHYKFKEVSSK